MKKIRGSLNISLVFIGFAALAFSYTTVVSVARGLGFNSTESHLYPAFFEAMVFLLQVAAFLEFSENKRRSGNFYTVVSYLLLCAVFFINVTSGSSLVNTVSYYIFKFLPVMIFAICFHTVFGRYKNIAMGKLEEKNLVKNQTCNTQATQSMNSSKILKTDDNKKNFNRRTKATPVVDRSSIPTINFTSKHREDLKNFDVTEQLQKIVMLDNEQLKEKNELKKDSDKQDNTEKSSHEDTAIKDMLNTLRGKKRL